MEEKTYTHSFERTDSDVYQASRHDAYKRARERANRLVEQVDLSKLSSKLVPKGESVETKPNSESK